MTQTARQECYRNPRPTAAPVVACPQVFGTAADTMKKFQVPAADPSGAPLTYSVQPQPPGTSFFIDQQGNATLVANQPILKDPPGQATRIVVSNGAYTRECLVNLNASFQGLDGGGRIQNPPRWNTTHTNQTATVGTPFVMPPVGAVPVSTGVTPADLLYEAFGLPDGLTMNPTTGEITGTPTKPGNYQVMVAVSHEVGGGGLNVDRLAQHQSFIITVNQPGQTPLVPPNLPPIWRQGIYRIVVSIGATLSGNTFTAYDPDGTPVTITVTDPPPPGITAAIGPGTIAWNGTVTGPPRTHRATATATSNGQSTPATFDFVIIP